MSPGSTTTTSPSPNGSRASSAACTRSRTSRSSGARSSTSTPRERAAALTCFRADGTALRWHALFSSPFFHPTVLVDRGTLDAARIALRPVLPGERGLRPVDAAVRFCGWSEPAEPLVEKRVHAAQASLRRSDLQQSFQRRVALREIALLAPGLGEEQAELAWGLGSGRVAPTKEAGHALLELLAAFERRHGRDRRVREAVGRVLVRGRLFGDAARLIGRRGSSRPAGADRDPCCSRLARADSLPRAAVRPRRSGRRHRPHRDLRRAFGRAPCVDGRAGAPSRLSAWRLGAGSRAAAPPSVSGHAGNRRRAPAGATGRRRRLRLEHVRVAARDRVVPRSSCPVRAPGREPRSRAAHRLAPGGQGSGRPATRAGRRERPRRRVRRSRVGHRARARPSVRRFANTIDVAAWTARATSLERTPSGRRRRSCSRSHDSYRTKGSTISSARSPRPATHAFASWSPATVPSEKHWCSLRPSSECG